MCKKQYDKHQEVISLASIADENVIAETTPADKVMRASKVKFSNDH